MIDLDHNADVCKKASVALLSHSFGNTHRTSWIQCGKKIQMEEHVTVSQGYDK